MNRPALALVAPPATDPVRLWLRLLSCATVVEKRLRRDMAEGHGSTLPRFDVLAALERAPDGLTLSALGRALLVSNGNVTGLVRTLAAEGFLTLAPAPGDKRASIATLTAAGRAHFATMAAAHRARIEAMFAGLSADESATLHAALGRLKQSIAGESAS